MKAKYLISLAAGMLILAGCMVTSVYPFYTEKDVTFDLKVGGSWTNTADADDHWVFENDGTNGYRLEYSNTTSTNHVAVTLFKLQDTSFMDFVSRDATEAIQPPPIPSHMLFRVTVSPDRIKMAPLSYEWLEKLVDKNPTAIRHYLVTDPDHHDSHLIVLTADTAELQKFVTRNLKTEDAWKDPFELVKVTTKNTGNK
jgi:hypothetical protein